MKDPADWIFNLEDPEDVDQIAPEFNHFSAGSGHDSRRQGFQSEPRPSDLLNQDIDRIAEMLTDDPDLFNEEEKERGMSKERQKKRKEWRKTPKGKAAMKRQRETSKKRYKGQPQHTSTDRWRAWNERQKGEHDIPKKCKCGTTLTSKNRVGHHSEYGTGKVTYMCRSCHYDKHKDKHQKSMNQYVKKKK